MKLLQKYNRMNLAAAIFTFIIGSIAFYAVLNYVLLHQLDETLRSEQQEVIDYVKAHNQLPDLQNTKHQWTTVDSINVSLRKKKIISYQRYSERKKENEWIRRLSFIVNVQGRSYKISVNKSQLETEDLLQLIILLTMGMIGLIVLINLLVNRSVINRLWHPFYETLNKLKHYRVEERKPLLLSTEKIDEFNLLNETISATTQNIQKEYEALKMFTENASHEMQTPLAVIRSKTELLLQQDTANSNENTIKQLLAVEDAAHKLSRLNQSLLLLAKIENSQFVFNETVDMAKLIEQKLDEKEELFEAKKITVQKHLEFVSILFHTHLADIFINNLVSNTLRYTPVEGVVQVQLTKEGLQIKNTAADGALDGEKIFQRFYKPDQSREGIGLGLAIVNEICVAAGFDLHYAFDGSSHCFSIRFNK
jgi:signal transduction histidine kinase